MVQRVWSVTGLRAATTPLPCIRSLRAYMNATSRTPGQGVCWCLGLPRQYLHFASPVRVQVQPRYSSPIFFALSTVAGLFVAAAWREDVNGGGYEPLSPIVVVAAALPSRSRLICIGQAIHSALMASWYLSGNSRQRPCDGAAAAALSSVNSILNVPFSLSLRVCALVFVFHCSTFWLNDITL